MAVEAGDPVIVRTASGQLAEVRAITGPQHGRDFLVVWVCDEQEWDAAEREGRDPEGVPWPAEAVQPSNGKLPA